MNQELLELANAYKQAGDAIHDAIKKSIVEAGGFINCSNNNFDRKDILGMVYDKKKGYTDKYLRGKNGEEHWMPLKGSSILFYQTILSIAATIDVYL